MSDSAGIGRGVATAPRPPVRARLAHRWPALVGAAALVLAAGPLRGDAGPRRLEIPDVPVVEAMPFSEAARRGLDADFPAACDERTGRVAVPFVLAPECYAGVSDNGGVTAPGVTGTSITVAVYLPDPEDPLVQLLAGPLGIDADPGDIEATYRGYAELFEATYQTYGRAIDIEVVRASGFSNDAVAARADAVRVADDLGAFAVWGGPLLTSAWADELAARGVICLGCATGGSVSWFDERAPYVYGTTMTGQQSRLVFVDWLVKQVAGRAARFAGDAALAARPRRFGYLHLETGPGSTGGADRMRDALAAQGVVLAVTVPYTLDIVRLQEQAAAAVTRFEAAGVTSVILSGDPLAPATFTAEATAQGYFPEWILSGSALVDTTFFARTYDQRQWAHAFGVTQLAARGRPELFAPYALYEWFHGTPPPAADTATILFPPPALFFAAVQAAGPTLTPATFRTGMFSQPPASGFVTFPSLSFGDHGIWPFRDDSGIDDTTELWWDPQASGPDELGNTGAGMYRYTDGGARHLPGAWPAADTRAFDPNGAVALYDELPPSDRTPAYEPP